MKKSHFISFIPVILPALTLILLGITTIVESYSRETVLYSIIAFLTIILLFLGWLPNIGLSIFIFIKNKKNNSENSFEIILGIIGIIISIVWFLLFVLIFIRGQSV